ncbi:MAG TPA: EF-P lysine aminoacylase GenX [Halothiobacillus sp.]|nr:EF-P lysine aminoacylase GenX [Halothiobacillus sp.]
MNEKINWRPGCDLAVLHLRARLMRALRAFMDQRNILEVETPLLIRAANYDLNVQNILCQDESADPRPLALHSSPELFMKRLLAAGTGPIWQLCKVFRKGEQGSYHNPEFTMLEWYRPGMDVQGIADESLALFQHIRESLGFAPLPVHRISYREAFETVTGINPHHADAKTLAFWASKHELNVHQPESLDRDQWLDLIMNERVQTRFDANAYTVISEFPASQAALACIRNDEYGTPVAERIEIYQGALELANGYYELTDPAEQRARFEYAAQQRRQNGQPELVVDARFLAALEHGLPDCAGLSVGIDRLLMTLTGETDIRRVLAFDFERL